MDYSVGEDNARATITKSWMDASGSGFIPTAFIVDRKGKIAWIGNSIDLGPALETALTGSGDPQKAVARQQARDLSAVNRLGDAAKRGDLKAVLAIRKTIPHSADTGSIYGTLARHSRADADAFAESLLSDPSAGMWDCLSVAWQIAQPNSPWAGSGRLALKLVLAAQKRADPSEESQVTCLDYLSGAYETCGDYPKAISTCEQALALMRKSKKDYEGEHTRMEQQLVHFREAQKTGKPRRDSTAATAATAAAVPK